MLVDEGEEENRELAWPNTSAFEFPVTAGDWFNAGKPIALLLPPGVLPSCFIASDLEGKSPLYSAGKFPFSTPPTGFGPGVYDGGDC